MPKHISPDGYEIVSAGTQVLARVPGGGAVLARLSPTDADDAVQWTPQAASLSLQVRNCIAMKLCCGQRSMRVGRDIFAEA